MSQKQSVFIATSMDGFIARANDDIDWLTEFESAGEDYGFKEFMDSVDALVMGRNTFEVVKEFGEWPYGPKKVIVLSSNESLEIPERFSERVNVMSGSPQEIVDQLSERALFHLYIDDGQNHPEISECGADPRDDDNTYTDSYRRRYSTFWSAEEGYKVGTSFYAGLREWVSAE
jgi:hypothetical protein